MTKHVLQTWKDEFLHWNKTYYGVDILTVDAKRIWLPEVIILNRYCTLQIIFPHNTKQKDTLFIIMFRKYSLQ